MQSVWRDIRYGFRGLRNQPGFTVLAVAALGLGIGASTTIFSVIYHVLLDPFPYTDAERVVAIQIHDVKNARPGGRTFFQTPEFLDYQEQSHVFEEVIGGTFEDVLHTTREGAEQFSGGMVTPNMFDAKPGAPPVFVMAHKMWLKQYNLDPSILRGSSC